MRRPFGRSCSGTSTRARLVTPKSIEPLLTADADQLVSDGTWRWDREELVKGMLESSRKNPAKRTIAVESSRMLSPHIVPGRRVAMFKRPMTAAKIEKCGHPSH